MKIIKQFFPAYYCHRVIAKWERAGKPVPPPHCVKGQIVKYYARQFNLLVLVETGTFRGDMIRATQNNFNKIYSIEIGDSLYQRAKKMFAKATHIELIHGDSGKELRAVMKNINSPALFWLDGHYSGGVTSRGEKDTPIYEELTHILDSPEMAHVILIDDARVFGSNPAYPSIAELTQFIYDKKADIEIVVRDDIIRVTPATKIS